MLHFARNISQTGFYQYFYKDRCYELKVYPENWLVDTNFTVYLHYVRFYYADIGEVWEVYLMDESSIPGTASEIYIQWNGQNHHHKDSGFGTPYLSRLNKELGFEFPHNYQIRQVAEAGQSIQRPEHCDHKDGRH